MMGGGSRDGVTTPSGTVTPQHRLHLDFEIKCSASRLADTTLHTDILTISTSGFWEAVWVKRYIHFLHFTTTTNASLFFSVFFFRFLQHCGGCCFLHDFSHGCFLHLIFFWCQRITVSHPDQWVHHSAKVKKSGHLDSAFQLIEQQMDELSYIYREQSLMQWSMHWGKVGGAHPWGTQGGGGWSYIKTILSVQRREKGTRWKPLCCRSSERASLCGCLYFFQCDFSLPPSQSVSASLVWGFCVLKGHPSGLSEVGVLQVR